MLPVIGLLATAFAALGSCTLLWYLCLSTEDREKADRLACDYAIRLYNRKLHQLSHPEKRAINELVKGHFEKR